MSMDWDSLIQIEGLWLRKEKFGIYRIERGLNGSNREQREICMRQGLAQQDLYLVVSSAAVLAILSGESCGKHSDS